MRLVHWWLVLLLLLPLVACHSYDNKDYANMNDVPMQTVCVGRMLVDLPKGKQDWQQEFDHAEVSKLPASVNSKKAFEAYANKRKADLEKHTHYNPDGRVYNYKQVGDRAIIIQYEGKGSDKVSYTDRFLWLGDWGYRYETGALFKEEAVNLLPIMEKHFEHVLPIQNTDPPDKSGFCIDSALVTGDIGPIFSTLAVKANQWKGVVVDVAAREDDGTRKKLPWQKGSDHNKAITPFYALQVREDSAKEDEDTTSFDMIRKRERRLVGMSGEEFAFKRVLSNGRKYYRFMWGTVNENSRPDKSGFTLILHAGSKRLRGDYNAPPAEDDLLALWDAMLASLKRRSDAR